MAEDADRTRISRRRSIVVALAATPVAAMVVGRGVGAGDPTDEPGSANDHVFDGGTPYSTFGGA